MNISKVFWVLSTIVWIATSVFTFAITYDSASISISYNSYTETHADYAVGVIVLNVTHRGILFDAKIYLKLSLLDSASNILVENSTGELIRPGQSKTIELRLRITQDIANLITEYRVKLRLNLMKYITWISYDLEITRPAGE